MQDAEFPDHVRPLLFRDLLGIEAEADPLRVQAEHSLFSHRSQIDNSVGEPAEIDLQRVPVGRIECVGSDADGTFRAVRQSLTLEAATVKAAAGAEIEEERETVSLKVFRL